MTPRRGPLSENEKTLWICVAFPPLWLALPGVLICMGIEKIRDAYWGWKYRRAERLAKAKK